MEHTYDRLRQPAAQDPDLSRDATLSTIWDPQVLRQLDRLDPLESYRLAIPGREFDLPWTNIHIEGTTNAPPFLASNALVVGKFKDPRNPQQQVWGMKTPSALVVFSDDKTGTGTGLKWSMVDFTKSAWDAKLDASSRRAAVSKFAAARSAAYSEYVSRAANLPDYWQPSEPESTSKVTQYVLEHATRKLTGDASHHMVGGTANDIRLAMSTPTDAGTNKRVVLQSTERERTLTRGKNPIYSIRDDVTYLVDARVDKEGSIKPSLRVCLPEEPSAKHDPVWSGISAPEDNEYIKAAEAALSSLQEIVHQCNDVSRAARSDAVQEVLTKLNIQDLELSRKELYHRDKVAELAREFLVTSLQDTADRDLRGRHGVMGSRFAYENGTGLGQSDVDTGLFKESGWKFADSTRRTHIMNYIRRHEAKKRGPETGFGMSNEDTERLKEDLLMMVRRLMESTLQSWHTDQAISQQRSEASLKAIQDSVKYEEAARQTQYNALANAIAHLASRIDEIEKSEHERPAV